MYRIKPIHTYLLLVILTTMVQTALGQSTHADEQKTAGMQFIENKGQWDNNARFMAPVPNGHLFIEPKALHFIFKHPQDVAAAFKHPRAFEDDFKSFTVRSHAVRIVFEGSSDHPHAYGESPKSTYYNYFLGSDPAFWKSKVKAFEKVQFTQLYPNIGAALYGSETGGLKYDMIVNPGGRVSDIQLTYLGQQSLTLKDDGLHIVTTVNEWTEQNPYAYQWIDGAKKEIPCHFVVHENRVSFEVGHYDSSRPLIIDPQLIFSTYSGSSVDNFGHSATYDKDGYLYAAGIATSPTDFPNGRYPATPGAFQQVWGGGIGQWPQAGFPCDITISKYVPDGTSLLYATYLGGYKNDYPHSLVTDKYNNLVIFGTTLSPNFPVKAGCYDVSFNDSFDIIVSKLSSDGQQLLGSTYIGGSAADGINVADSLRMNYADEFRGEVIIDQSNDIIVASSTSSVNFPVTTGVVQSFKNARQDGCIFKLDSNLKVLKASTFIGQPDNDAIYSLDVDPSGTIYFAGGTQSQTFAVSPNSHLANYRGGFSDGFVGRINPGLTLLQNFRYWGSAAYDQAYFIKLDPTNNPVVFGQNYDSIPVIGPVKVFRNSSLFVTKFKPTLDSIIFSTMIGDSIKNNALPPSAFMVDECGVIYGSVWGGATNGNSRFATSHPAGSFISTTADLPLTADAEQSATDNSDFYLFALDKNASVLLYGSYYGELGSADHVDGGTSRFDKKGIVYQSVCASCNLGTAGAFPTTANSYSPLNKSPRCSNASFKLDFRKSNVVYAGFSFAPKKFCLDSYVVVNYTNTSYNGNRHYWYVNGVLRDTTRHFKDTIKTAGTYVIKLVEIDSARCIIIDSSTQSFTTSILAHASFTVKKDSCAPSITFTNTSTPANVAFRWYFGNGDTSSAQVVSKTFPANGLYQIMLIANPGSSCADSSIYSLAYDSLEHLVKASFYPADSFSCEPAGFNFINTSNKFSNLRWYINDTFVSTSFVLDTFFYKGKYRVKLVSIDSNSCNKMDSSTHNITIKPVVYPNFIYTQDTCSYTITFKNKSFILPGDTVSYLWRFPNGFISNKEDTTFKFDTAGKYVITLIANPGLACEQETGKDVTVNLLPGVLNAFFTPDPQQSCTPAIIKFNNLSANQQSQQWYFNNALRTTQQHFTDTFYSDTVIKVTLKIFSTLTCIPVDSFDTTITIINNTRSKFTLIRDTCSPQVIFKNESDADDNEPLTYMWYFGDGDSSGVTNPTHLYLKDSTFTIRLITNPGTFCADTSEETIVYKTTEHLLTSSFTLSDSVFCSPAIFNATNTSFNGQLYRWYLNGIPVSTGTHFTDTIETPGTYRLTLYALNDASCTKEDTTGRNITVNLSGLPDFMIARDSCSLLVQFKNQSVSPTGLPLPYTWYFGDGDSSTETNPTHQYTKTDLYTIQLLTNAGTPCVDTAVKTILIDGDSSTEIVIPNVFTPNADGLNDCYRITGVSEKCDEYKVSIYNRWGELYFESTNPSACWNGKNDAGVSASEGVYYYIMKIKKRDKPKIEKHGTITLLRAH
ncbi:MAG: PKD domain-containing protein [Bacteroidota bacterium]